MLAQTFTCNYLPNQLWYPIDMGYGRFAFINQYSGKCLDIAGGTTDHGYFVQQYDCHFGGNQLFEAVDIVSW